MIIDVESCLDYTCCLSTIKIHGEQVLRWKLKQMSWQVIAHMWGNEGILCWYQYGSTLWHLESRVEVAWDSYLSMLSNDSNRITLGFARNTASWVPSLWRSTDKQVQRYRELSGLHLLPVNDQDPLWASPTMETQNNMLGSDCRHVRKWRHCLL